MGEDEKVPKDVAGWKAPATDGEVGQERVSMTPIKRESADVPEDDGVSDRVRFFNVPRDLSVASLGDEDRTPVVRTAHDIAAEKQRLVEQRARDNQKRTAAERSVRGKELQKEGEMAALFQAVSEGDEDQVKGLFNREFGLKTFSSLGDFQESVREFISPEDHSMVLDISNLDNPKPTKYDSEIEIVFRPRIGQEAPMVNIRLGNRTDLGKNQNKQQTRVISIEIQRSVADDVVETQKSPTVVERVQQGWRRIIGKKDK